MAEQKTAYTEKEDQEDIELSWEDVLPEATKEQETTPPSGRESERTSATLQLPNLDLLLDIPIQICVEIGRTRMVVGDLLELSQGSVIELNTLVGQPLEVMVHDKLIARAEPVKIKEKLAIRITEIITPQERIEKLR